MKTFHFRVHGIQSRIIIESFRRIDRLMHETVMKRDHFVKVLFNPIPAVQPRFAQRKAGYKSNRVNDNYTMKTFDLLLLFRISFMVSRVLCSLLPGGCDTRQVLPLPAYASLLMLISSYGDSKKVALDEI